MYRRRNGSASVVAFIAVLLLMSVACAPEGHAPSPKDWSGGERLPDDPKGPTPTPSPTVSNDRSEGEERRGRDPYRNIDLEDGGDIPEGTCGDYGVPTSNEQIREIERCNPGHEYGVCNVDTEPIGKEAVIIGTSGDDILEGTSKDEYICGMGGNDIIFGGGGEDSIWGGPGNDYIVGGKHSDWLYGGDGDDVLVGNNNCISSQGPRCGVDFLIGDADKRAFADSGDDAIFGGAVSMAEEVNAGPGNDIVVPTVARVFGHHIVAGDGNDVVMTVNFSHGGNADHVNLGALDGKVKLGMPLGKTCSITGELDLEDPTQSDEGEITCSLPWPKKFSKLDNVVPLSASIDEKGEVSMDATLYNNLANLSVSAYRDMVKAQASLGGDVCICDPLMNPPPTEPFMPYDYDSS